MRRGSRTVVVGTAVLYLTGSDGTTTATGKGKGEKLDEVLLGDQAVEIIVPLII